MLTPFGYFDLIDEMAKTGCPICNLLVRDGQKTMGTILYEYVVQPHMHELFRASRGLCNNHAWDLTEQGNAMSVGVLYRAVVDEMLKEMTVGISPRKSVRRLFGKAENHETATSIAPKEPCPVCVTQETNEKRYIVVFSEHMTDPKLASAYQTSQGLCLNHFMQVLNRTTDDEIARILVEMQREIWSKLRADLAEFIRKYDFYNVDEVMGEEGDSWLRAVRQVSGEKGVFGLRRTP